MCVRARSRARERASERAREREREKAGEEGGGERESARKGQQRTAKDSKGQQRERENPCACHPPSCYPMCSLAIECVLFQ